MKLERILSETNFPDSSNSSLEQPVLVHCLLCLSFSQSTQYSSVDWPILTPLDLPPPSPPCRGASRRFQAKVPRHVQPVGRSGRRGQQSVSEPASLCPSVSSPPPVLLNFRQFCMQSGFAAGAACCVRRSREKLLVPRKFAILQSSMISDSTLARKFATSSSIVAKSRVGSYTILLYSTRKNHPLASSCCCCWYYTQYGSAPIDCIYEG